MNITRDSVLERPTVNIADVIEHHARERPQAPALLMSRAHVMNYGKLNATVCRIASAFRDAGIKPGEIVGFAWDFTPLSVVFLLALARAGAVSIPVSPNERRSKRRAIVEEFGVTTLVAAKKEYDVEGCRPLLLRDIRQASEESRVTEQPAFEGGDHPWAIILTSGTTGRPKGIVRSHAEAVTLAGLQARLLNIRASDRFLCCVSLNFAASQMRVLRHLLFGSAVVFPAGDMAETIERERITHAFITPIVLDEWMSRLPRDQQPLDSLTHFASGGGPIPAGLFQQFTDRISPNLFMNYGTVETALAAVADPETYRRFPGSVGRVVPWIQAEIVDERHNALPSGEIGFLRFRGEGVATGYYRHRENGDITAKGFRDGWFYPGDMARMTPDGILYVEGRCDDVINLGGAKVNAGEIEEVLMAHPAVAEAAVLRKTSQEGMDIAVAAVVVRGPFDEAALLQHCKSILGAARIPQRVFCVPKLPRNAMGKIVKAELARYVGG
jgi:acyl-coenzyme A synthetase/AMP-(fatty) acid ligase